MTHLLCLYWNTKYISVSREFFTQLLIFSCGSHLIVMCSKHMCLFCLYIHVARRHVGSRIHEDASQSCYFQQLLHEVRRYLYQQFSMCAYASLAKKFSRNPTIHCLISDQVRWPSLCCGNFSRNILHLKSQELQTGRKCQSCLNLLAFMNSEQRPSSNFQVATLGM